VSSPGSPAVTGNRPSGGGPGGKGEKRAVPWYQRRAALVTLGVMVVVGIAVVTDLPAHTSRASDISAETSVMNEVNTDIAPCSYALHETLTIWEDEQHQTLSPSDSALTPSLLRDDQLACSFTNSAVFDLSNVEVPGTSAGKRIGDLVGVVTLWVTSDALGAIEDVQALVSDPTDAAKRSDLAARERQLTSDRSAADRDTAAADRILDTRLPRADLTAVSPPG
jgi:hypothetical protein